ncbi:short-chain fatty acyl-CoA regulator family protein [Bosea sp. NPDC003192]|uniref:short-chain fatty acyl-CoA regulator family protein n=1 Tax=Bosea sp. NPDC003192 TaxID=3390551 RepID=UPI003D045F29
MPTIWIRRTRQIALIGTSCRLCERDNCTQRAFPPAGRSICVDHDNRFVVPYSLRTQRTD